MVNVWGWLACIQWIVVLLCLFDNTPNIDAIVTATLFASYMMLLWGKDRYIKKLEYAVLWLDSVKKQVEKSKK